MKFDTKDTPTKRTKVIHLSSSSRDLQSHIILSADLARPALHLNSFTDPSEAISLTLSNTRINSNFKYIALP